MTDVTNIINPDPLPQILFKSSSDHPPIPLIKSSSSNPPTSSQALSDPPQSITILPRSSPDHPTGVLLTSCSSSLTKILPNRSACLSSVQPGFSAGDPELPPWRRNGFPHRFICVTDVIRRHPASSSPSARDPSESVTCTSRHAASVSSQLRHSTSAVLSGW